MSKSSKKAAQVKVVNRSSDEVELPEEWLKALPSHLSITITDTRNRKKPTLSEEERKRRSDVMKARHAALKKLKEEEKAKSETEEESSDQ
jgi:hypothetical protein